MIRAEVMKVVPHGFVLDVPKAVKHGLIGA